MQEALSLSEAGVTFEALGNATCFVMTFPHGSCYHTLAGVSSADFQLVLLFVFGSLLF